MLKSKNHFDYNNLLASPSKNLTGGGQLLLQYILLATILKPLLKSSTTCKKFFFNHFIYIHLQKLFSKLIVLQPFQNLKQVTVLFHSTTQLQQLYLMFSSRRFL